jgi:hypothetical protein
MSDKAIEGTDSDGSVDEDRTLGKLHRTENLDRKFGSGTHYTRVLVVSQDEESFETLLLTDADLHTLRARAEANPEDCLEPTWSDKVRAS